ncbi:hypothetical protein PQ455_05950 [Sphingomonas naphthae]|uniref:Uncharacterized protein n=1 Tax=Sphingomonas naphthae TaxID=1813468 RepID=A0ABY7TP52_9SPHN|nr:hypothetical protein [Sphingomonas naphthae]WCT74766.1 hypothetical protein PQ455_05950 [Sphingomonas naphthae]
MNAESWFLVLINIVEVLLLVRVAMMIRSLNSLHDHTMKMVGRAVADLTAAAQRLEAAGGKTPSDAIAGDPLTNRGVASTA